MPLQHHLLLPKKGLRVSFDGSIANNETGGTVIRRTSNNASVQLGSMRWDNELVMEVNKKLGDSADDTIGYDLFENKVIEIDFDKMLFMVHDKRELPGTVIKCLPCTLAWAGCRP